MIDNEDDNIRSDAHTAFNQQSKIDKDIRDELNNKLHNIKDPELVKNTSLLQNDSKRDIAVDNIKHSLTGDDTKNFQRIINDDNAQNKKIDDVFNKATYVYRGVSKEEFENIQKTGMMELGKNSPQDVIFSSISPETASLWAKDDGVILQLDVKKLGPDAKPFHKSTFGTSHDFKNGLYGNINELGWYSIGINPKGVKSDVIKTVFK